MNPNKVMLYEHCRRHHLSNTLPPPPLPPRPQSVNISSSSNEQNKKNPETADIENCDIPDILLKSLVVNDYVERDTEDFEKKGINNTIYMIEKAKMYDIPLSRDIKQYSEQRNFRLFYTSFSLDDLCVLGY